MGTGGEGIEFFSHLFSQPPHFKQFAADLSLLNRTSVIISKFFDILASTIMYDSSDINQLAYTLSNKIFENRDDILSEAENLINNRYVFRMHFNNNSFFNSDNTYYIFLDKFEWFEYKWAMWFEKVWTYSVGMDNVDNIYQHRIIRPKLENNQKLISNFEKLRAMIDEQKPRSLTEGYFSFLDFIDEIPKDYLNIPIRELINLAKNRVNEESYESYLKKVDTSSALKVKFSDILHNGAFEKLFNTTDPSITEKISSWHSKNLQLMNNAGYNIARYI